MPVPKMQTTLLTIFLEGARYNTEVRKIRKETHLIIAEGTRNVCCVNRSLVELICQAF